MNLRKTAFKGIKWTTIGTGGLAIFQLLQISILTRILPKEAFGLIAMAQFFVSFSNIFADMGMSSAIMHKQDITRKEYSSIYWLNIFISIGFYLLLVVLTPSFSRFYTEPELLSIIPILGINILIIASGRQHRTIMQKLFYFKSIALIEIVSYLIGLLVAVFLALKEFGVYSLVYSTLTSSFISNGLFLILNLKQNPIKLYFNIKQTKSFLKIGGYTMGSSLLDFFSREIDTLIIGKMLGSENLGVYNLTKQIVMKLFTIINPIIINVLNPLLSSIQKEKKRLKSVYLKVVKYLSYINFPIYLIIIVCSKEILNIIYGPDYVDASSILSFLAFSYCLTAISNPVGSLQIATGRTDLGLRWTVFRVLITPVIIYGGSLISVEAVAAFKALLSLSLILPLWIMQLKPMANIKIKEYLQQFYKPLLLFIVVTIVIFQLDDKITFYDYELLSLIIKTTVTSILFLSFYFIFDRKVFSESIKYILEPIIIKKRCQD